MINLSLSSLAIFFLGASFILAMQRHKKHMLSLEAALSVSEDGFLVFDEDENLKYLNDIARKLFQKLNDKSHFKNLSEFISCVFDHANSDVFTESMPIGNSDFREVIEDGQGNFYHIEMHKQDNHFTSAIIRDVTFLKKRDFDYFALKEVNEKLNLAVESSSCGIFILNAKSEEYPLIFANRLCRDLCPEGVDKSIEFSKFLSLLGETDQKDNIFAAMIKRNSLQKHVFFDGVIDKRWFDFRLTPVFDQQGSIDLYVGVIAEITDLKNKELEINRAQKLDSLGQLSAGIAHDFNNILSIIEGYARMIEMNSQNSERVSEYAQKITEASARGAGLTKKMMAFARHKVKQDHVTDLKVLIAEQEVLLTPLLDGSIDFEVTLDDGDFFASCEADSFVQILMNLVVNARDAMTRGGRLRVNINVVEQKLLPDFVKDRDHSYLCLRVTDNGMGMTKDVCERIFDPFFTTKEQGQGTGLGLSVTYGLVRDMGGYIDVRSELSVGTEFSVYIPLSDKAPRRKTGRQLKKIDADGFDFSGFTALVVEDEPDLLLILSETLERHNMTVIQAESGSDALVVQDDYMGDVDLLITDLVMPGINGLKLADMMKALHPNIETVFMSGYPARGEQAKVIIPDDALFMPKPLDYDALCQCLSHALKPSPSNVVPISHQNTGEV